jgi:quercetin dioxygenase-like cupin family protein
MNPIRIRNQRDNQWISGKEFTPPGIRQRFSGEELDATRVRVHEPGDESTPQLFELAFEPGLEVAVHSHAADEIFYVVQGSFEIGNQSLVAGSSVLIRANTLYSFRAGPQGLQVLNFRPRADAVYRTVEEHQAWGLEKSKL